MEPDPDGRTGTHGHCTGLLLHTTRRTINNKVHISTYIICIIPSTQPESHACAIWSSPNSAQPSALGGQKQPQILLRILFFTPLWPAILDHSGKSFLRLP
uniref:Uncharacterized protein n=1 Tax=Oryza brachyantha TaxID=4533 RepID=J3LHJ1_ORYBR